MAVIKFTMIFAHSTIVGLNPQETARTGGWSESFYHEGSVVTARQLAIAQGGICIRRAWMLASSAGIIAQRYQQIAPTVGRAQTFTDLFPGQISNPPDIPQMALLLTFPAIAAENVRKQILRGIPDDFIQNGVFTPNGQYDTAIINYLNAISSWKMRGLNLANPQRTVIAFDLLAGTVATDEAHGFAPGDQVRFTRLKTASGSSIPPIGPLKVLTAPTASTFTVASQGLSSVNATGKVQEYEIVYPSIDGPNCDVTRTTTRKVGRPFGAYRGRVSRRA